MKKQTLLILGLLGLQLGCGRQEPAPAEPVAGGPAVSVKVITAQLSSLEQPYQLPGTVRARQKVVITSKLPGTLESVEVRMGDRVRVGQRLAAIEERGPAIEVEQTKAAMEAARRGREQAEKAVVAAEADARLAAATLQRIQQLFDKRSASQQELDQARARQQTAQAGVEMAQGRVAEARAHEQAAAAAGEGAQLQLSYTKIDSPLEGYVVARYADPGAVVAPGMPLLELEEAGDYRLEIAVPESQLGDVHKGSEVGVEIAAIGLRGSGRVIEIEPAAEPGSRSTLVRVQLPANAGLRSGLFATATISAGKQEMLLLPEEVIVRQGQLASVYINDHGVARRRLVSPGRQMAAGTEILAGLQAGEQVIAGNLGQLADGSPVEIAR